MKKEKCFAEGDGEMRYKIEVVCSNETMAKEIIAVIDKWRIIDEEKQKEVKHETKKIS